MFFKAPILLVVPGRAIILKLFDSFEVQILVHKYIEELNAGFSNQNQVRDTDLWEFPSSENEFRKAAKVSTC
jgi:hypothetical protein